MDIGLVFPGCHKRGGVERSVWEAAVHWSHSHHVSVYAEDIDAVGLDDVDLIRIPRSVGPETWQFARFGANAARKMAGHRHDHVISFGVANLEADVLWVNSIHRAWLQRSREFVEPGRGRHPAMRYLLPRHQARLLMERSYFRRDAVRRIFVVSDHVGKDLERLYQVPTERLVTINNGYSATDFSPVRSAERDAARSQLGLPLDAIVCVVVANELKRKGFGVVLDAVARVADPRLHVLLVGKTPPTAFEAKLMSPASAGRVTYAGMQTDMGRIYAASDLFVLPTQYEAFCLAIVEALASGLPVITTNVPGAGDLVQNGVNGMLQRDPLDAQELAELLEKGTDPVVRTAWAQAAAPSVAHLSWSTLFDVAAVELEAIG